jgi:DNA-binding winged helix-turn-helix (wHTH) protein
MLQARPVNLGLSNIAASLICGHLRAIARGAPNRQIKSREDLLWGYGHPNEGEVSMRAPESTTGYRPLPWTQTPAVTQFHSGPRPDERHAFPSPFFAKRTEPTRIAPTEVSFGPFRLLPTQFLLLDGDKPVSLGSRALEILTVLLERPGEVVSKQELMARVWPNVFVEPANLTVHVSALRRTLRDGRDGNRFIINVPGRGYSFVASVAVAA